MASDVSLTYNELLQRYVDEYLESSRKESATAREIAVWLIKTGRWEAPADVMIRQCREDVARAMREDYLTDDRNGHPVRAKHVRRVMEDGEQLHLWADIRFASRKFIEASFQQRREQIVGDCRQLKYDADYYNDNYSKAHPIQLIFDFRDDLEEGDLPGEYPPKKPR